MTLGRIGCALAVLAVLSVLTIFFFPGIEGPYSAVHGPVTALLSIRAAAGLRMAIVRAGLKAVRDRLSRAHIALLTWSRTVVSSTELWPAGLSAEHSSILRC